MTPNDLAALSKGLDETVEGLANFDADGLESLEQRLRVLTAQYRARGLEASRENLPELLQKHTLLQAILKATAANLKVVESVLDVRRTKVNDRRETIHGYFDRTAEPVAERPAGERDRPQRHGE